LPIWYLETGYQTQADPDKASLYAGVETWPGALPDLVPGAVPAQPPDLSPAPDQAEQLSDSLQLTYCQPYVTGVFNFLIRDERDLAGWQSGVLWTDGSSKDSYVPFRDAVREVNEQRVDCARVAAAVAASVKPKSSAPGATAAPAATRSLTKLTVRQGERGRYGFVSLDVRLTRGLQASQDGLAAKQLLFNVAGTAYVVATDRQGVARLTPMPPMNPGRHKVRISFRGDERNLASGVRFDARVANSKGGLRSAGRVPLSSTVSGSVTLRSNGTKIIGAMRLRQRGKERSVRLLSFGLRSDARAAWVRGRSGPDRYVLNVERLRRKPLVRVRLWQNGMPVGASAVVGAARIRLTRG
jgi:hypothetical protein